MITVTGATGKTGSGVANILIECGEKIRVVGRSAERLEQFRIKGAEIAVGDQGDADFFTEALAGAEALYLLIPPKFDAEDFRAYYNQIGDAAVTAIQRSGITKVVFLSSLGADQPEGTGPVVGLHDVEQKLEQLKDVDIVFLRPGYFMENTLGNMKFIRTQALNGGPMPADVPVMMAATADIAEKAAKILADRSFTGHTIIEIIGDRISFKEITAILGEHLGIPSLHYIQFSDSDAEGVFTGMGLSHSVAHSYVELMHAITDGTLSTTQTEPGTLTAPTRFVKFVENVYKPTFEASKHHAMA
jgi:uncharacterized protein YbjT (DUF2867 family)